MRGRATARRAMETAGEVLAQWERDQARGRGPGGRRAARRAAREPARAALRAQGAAPGRPGGMRLGGRQAGRPRRRIPPTRDEAEREVGELLLEAVAALARLGVDPELALRAGAPARADAARRRLAAAVDCRARWRRSRSIHGRQILDSRGNPTVEVEVVLDSGARGSGRGPVRRLDRRVRGRRAPRRRRGVGRQGRRQGRRQRERRDRRGADAALAPPSSRRSTAR